MSDSNESIVNQYHVSGLFEEIVRQLESQGINTKQISRSSIAAIDEFHVRGAAVSKELAAYIDQPGLSVIDIGCGLGGPCRMLAEEFNCNVTGIDMNTEFIRTAQKLTEWVGLTQKINFVQGDALQLPFPDKSFDVAWTQHVQMNIEDKQQFYAEMSRVLKPGGAFIYYDIFDLGNGPINFPVPWANEPAVSFLGTISGMETILRNLGFTKIQTSDQTDAGISFLYRVFENINTTAAPKPGLNLVMGVTMKEKLSNLLKGLAEDKIALQSGIYRKQ
ncbi:MAG TPA: class I SAM-dependent methyltransferase [Cytophagales bacterium]|mgnify:CR=1 FL=1|nr:class I SAM-dependent methyltransferase [Cytophagales bacterium]